MLKLSKELLPLKKSPRLKSLPVRPPQKKRPVKNQPHYQLTFLKIQKR
jgi:hypothetical protein